MRSTDNTLELNLEAGLLYNCDYHDDEMPYPIEIGGKTLIMIPHQYTINDHRMQEEGTRHEFFEKFKDEFDYRYKIGDKEPTMMNVITHGYLSSRVPVHRHVRENHRLREKPQRCLVRPARRHRGLGKEVLHGGVEG